MEITVSYFEKEGKDNTIATFAAARRRADELGITQIVVASSNGFTGMEAAKAFDTTSTRIVSVSLSAGFAEDGWSLTAEERRSLEEAGVTVLTSLHSLSADVSEAFGGVPTNEIVRNTLYTFGQGMKVAVECALMAADAGLLDMKSDVISIAGSGRGADTAILIKPVFARKFTELRIKEILAKPR